MTDEPARPSHEPPRPAQAPSRPTGARSGTSQHKNLPAFVALFCGVASWVPLIIVITGPLTFLFAGLAVVVARRRGEGRNQLRLAWWGILLTVGSVLLQFALAALAGGIGWVGRLFGG